MASLLRSSHCRLVSSSFPQLHCFFSASASVASPPPPQPPLSAPWNHFNTCYTPTITLTPTPSDLLCPFQHLNPRRNHVPNPPSLSKPQFKFKSKHHFLPILCSSNSQSNPSPFSLVSFLRWIPDWADRVKESRMRSPRPLYTPENWRDHRSSRRHLRHLLTSLFSRVILSLILSLSLAWLSNSIFPVFKTSPLPYQLTAPALALLLVFKTEASYSRFVEGRKVWMKVITGVGELASMVLKLRPKDDWRIRRSLINYIMAFPMALKV